MSEAVRIENISRAFWPEGDAYDRPQVFALLDGARNRHIEDLLAMSGLDRACLYNGRLVRRLERAAPSIVHLRGHTWFTEQVLGQGWGRSWGSFVLAPPHVGLPRLREHFRRFLRVVDEQGRRMLFRYYDPRVLRVYLPTCTAEEAATFFGPVLAFHTEGESPQTLLTFQREGDGVATRQLAV
jgi:hypothetical protein